MEGRGGYLSQGRGKKRWYLNLTVKLVKYKGEEGRRDLQFTVTTYGEGKENRDGSWRKKNSHNLNFPGKKGEKREGGGGKSLFGLEYIRQRKKKHKKKKKKKKEKISYFAVRRREGVMDFTSKT